MTPSPPELCAVGHRSMADATPLDGVKPAEEPLAGTDAMASFDAAVSRYWLPGELDDSGSSNYVSPVAGADSDSERSMAGSPVGFAASVASHGTVQTELTTPETATAPLPKPELYPTTQSSPMRKRATFCLPSPGETPALGHEADPALSPCVEAGLDLISAPGHSTPVLGSGGDGLWSRSPAPCPISPHVDAIEEEDEDAKFRRLEQSLDLLVFNDEEDSAEMSRPLLEEPAPVLRSLGSEKIVVVFRSPTLSDAQSARMDRFDTPLLDSPDLGPAPGRDVSSEATGTGINRAVLMAPQDANQLLGFEPESDVVVATVEDAHAAALRALRSPGSEDLDLASAAPLEASRSLGPPTAPTDTDLTDFSFMCDVMDTSAAQDDSFFSTVSEQGDGSTIGSLSLSCAWSAAQSTTADRSASSVLARPRPQTYRSTRYNSPFANSDAPVVVPKRSKTVRDSGNFNGEKSVRPSGASHQKDCSRNSAKSVEKLKPMEKAVPTTTSGDAKRELKFDLPIRPRSIRRTSMRRKWTVSYIDSVGRGVPHASAAGRNMLDRTRFDAKLPTTPRAPLAVLSAPQEPVRLRERYPTISTLIPSAQPVPSVKALSDAEATDPARAKAPTSSPSQTKGTEALPDILVSLKPAQSAPSGAQPGDQLEILREAIALAQEELARLESAEKAARRSRKGGSFLSSLRRAPAGLKPDQAPGAASTPK